MQKIDFSHLPSSENANFTFSMGINSRHGALNSLQFTVYGSITINGLAELVSLLYFSSASLNMSRVGG